MAAEPGGRMRCFDSRMSRADDDDVKLQEDRIQKTEDRIASTMSERARRARKNSVFCLLYSVFQHLLPSTEALEDLSENVVARAAADDLVEQAARVLQIGKREFFGGAVRQGIRAAGESLVRAREQIEMPLVRDGRRVARDRSIDQTICNRRS